MTAKAVDTAGPFAELTCRTLTAAVLRLSGTAHQPAGHQIIGHQPAGHQANGLEPPVPQEMIDGLRALAAADPAWAHWVRTVRQYAMPADMSAQSELRESGLRASERFGSDDGIGDHCWAALAARLPELLVRYSPAVTTDAVDSAWSGLLSTCHVTLRLRALETRFAEELQRQKREAVYHFAYGLSHELNNPLANIATRGGVLAAQESHPQRKTLLEAIVANAMRGCEMLGDLMLVARPPKLIFKATRVDLLVTSVVDSARCWAQGLDVQLALHVQSTQQAELDAAALREALWALIRNGLEAMFDGGTIAVSVTDFQPQPSDLAWVCIEISDRGSGMSQAALEHCFDPYYSGREAGRGLGLGLSKAQRIVELHRGHVTLANRPGGGVVARVLLPAQRRV